VKAVNLIPQDLRGASGGGTGSPVGVTLLLVSLAVAVLLVGFWAVTSRQVSDREAEVARVNAEAQAAETQAANLSGYEAVVKAADERRTAVVELIEARVDWADALSDVSRTVPEGVSLTQMGATVAPGVAVEGASGNPLRASVSAPAIEIAGCAPSQEAVSALMSRLRSMKGVTKVALASSEKADTEGGAASSDSAGAQSGDCTAGSDQRPRFEIVVFYGKFATATEDSDGGTTTTAEGSGSGDDTTTGSTK
jgi:Tfp pilus assembly protein PilN